MIPPPLTSSAFTRSEAQYSAHPPASSVSGSRSLKFSCPQRRMVAYQGGAAARRRRRMGTAAAPAAAELERNSRRFMELPRQRVGAQLELEHLARGALAALHVKWRSGADRRPQRPALPPGAGIVDPAIHPFGVESQWIRDAQHDPFPFLENQQPFGPVAGVDRHVRAEAEHAELIDPGVVAGLCAAPVGDTLDLWEWLGIEAPALGTVLAGRGRSVERSLAFPAVEAREMAAGERRPVDAVPVHVTATRGEPLDGDAGSVERQLVQLRERRLRGVRTGNEPHDGAREAQ